MIFFKYFAGSAWRASRRRWQLADRPRARFRRDERAGVLARPVVGRWPGYADDHQGADGRQYLVVVAGGMVPQGRKPEIRSSPMPCPDE